MGFKGLHKKAFLFVFMPFLALFLSGCITVDEYISIDRKGNVRIEEYTKIRNEAMQMLEEGINNRIDELNSKKGSNFYMEKTVDDTNTTVKITKIIHNIQKNDIDFQDLTMSNVVKAKVDGGRFVDADKSFFQTKYDIDFDVVLAEDINYFDTSFTIKIPVSADSCNSVSSDTKKHAYNIQLSYTTINILNILLCIIPLILLISGGVVMVLKIKNKPSKAELKADEAEKDKTSEEEQKADEPQKDKPSEE